MVISVSWPPEQARAGLRTLGRTNVRPVEAERGDDLGMRNPPRWRAVARPALAGLAPAGLALMAVAVLPPVETLARRYLVVESVQFCLLSMAGPALIVLGAPWRLLRLSRGQAEEPGGRPDQARTHRGPADRLAARRLDRPSFAMAMGFGVWWVGVCVFWRLPPVLDALARHPTLIVAELATLSPAGVALWLELVNSRPLTPRVSRPRRAAIAALAMWSTWAIAFVLGFASGPVVHAYDGAGSSLSAVADQELAAFVLWLAAACCFVPVIFVALLTWLRDGADSGEEPARSGVRGWGRPPGERSRSSAGQAGR
jgi:cytochrome c oxidase assembly factor CtaG